MNRTPFERRDDRLVDEKNAQLVIGVLGFLIRLAGPYSSIGVILQQARSEIISLLRSQQQATPEIRAAA
ncbi:MAG: hypothetical protein N2039_11975 [Gemmataceae bacterium]|nr:hypothetical protein [Gemmataceae bacterium]